jgi:hypothetical protein
MMEWWNAISVFEKVFWFIAVPFTTIFAIQAILTLFGLGGDTDADADFNADATDIDLDTDFEADMDTADDVDMDEVADSSGFKLLTVRSIITFFTVFGWTGIVAINAGADKVITIVVSFMLGIGMMALVAFIFYSISNLTESGTVHLKYALNTIGDVYLTIPPDKSGTGKVHVNVQGRLREVNAITKEKEELKTGTKIRVVGVIQGELLLVEKV